MGDRYRDSLSSAPLAYNVRAEFDGELWYPGVSATVFGAYLRTAPGLAGGKPTDDDWIPGTFEITANGTVRALVPCGPATSNDLDLGPWFEWVKINDPVTGGQPVEQPGRVIIQ
ncbi:MAG TPA: hypothetical protein VFY84_19165 [Jiangellales bacterium]|nr:hypothetical protein [Jiangellales bacterium]